MNGVTGSVLQVLEQLSRRGHELLVIAPDAGRTVDCGIDPDLRGARMELLRSYPLPSYPDVRVVLTRPARISTILRRFGAEVVHLASPFALGWAGVRAAETLGIPSVAVYQTDVIAYADKYRVLGGAPIVASHVTRLHRRATLTLVPSTSTHAQLTALGIERLRHWGRGVDAERFAPERRSEAWRNEVAPGRSIVGYVGRLAPEKQVEDLLAVHDLPAARLLIVGDGPSRAELERLLPRAHFTGHLGGMELARAMASIDVFVHPGETETFCQTVQEAQASGVPVVATGKGGPLDLVRNSIDGWTYRPGDLAEMRSRVEDLVGDHGKRAAFSRAARGSVRHRTWSSLCEQLVDHYREAQEVCRPRVLAGMPSRPSYPQARSAPAGAAPNWRRYVALGDSVTEGLCDSSRMPEGEYLGWAARLAMLLSDRKAEEAGIRFANLAVRSRQVRHLEAQVDQALSMRPDLVSVLIGANDLVRARIDVDGAARRLNEQVARLRAAGADVLIGTPFLPGSRVLPVLANRFSEFADRVREIARSHGCYLLDTATIPGIADPDVWADDRVHLTPAGHRILAYHAAAVLGVSDAKVLGSLERAFHDEADTERGRQGISRAEWLRAYALPWLWRRMRRRTAGDGRGPKHHDYVELSPDALGEAASPAS
ncbi:GDSL-type esterase/lipase family protein [Leucobacter sp. wl10]|uniref:GDSL-type esterase/lipase family protein n=1 Tax=Leucobacter sp. wl10 TaxID=2304677 RepID=UPI0026C60FE5|nr:GDSL-type esterase/lipase family protein [Leucobacter sp. wl10]